MEVKTILRSVVWAAAGSWGGRIVSIMLFVIMTRLLPPEAIGAVALIATYLMFLQIFGDPGLSDFIVKHHEREERTEHTIFWTQFGLASVVGVGLWIGAPWLALTLSPTVPGEDLIRAMSFIPPLGALGMVAEALLRRQLAFKQLAMRSLLGAVISGVVGVAAAYRGYGVWALVIKQFIELVINVIGLLTFARWHPRFIFDHQSLVAPLRFGSAVFGARVVTFLQNRLDVLIVGWLLGSAALGHYAIAQRAFQIVSELLNGVVAVVGAPLMAHAKKTPGELATGYLRLVKGASTVSMPAYAILGAAAPLVVIVVFGPQWTEAVEPMMWLCVAGVMGCPGWFNAPALQMSDRAATWMWIVCGFVVLGAILMPLGAITYGLAGVAASQVVRSIIMWPIACRITLKTLGISWRRFFDAWRPSLLISLVAAAAVLLAEYLVAHVDLAQKVRFLVVMGVGASAFLGALLVFSPGLLVQIKNQVARRRQPS